MKEATGELNMTVITIIAISAIAAILWAMWPSIQSSIENSWAPACTSNADCGEGRICVGGTDKTPGKCKKG